MLTDLKSQAFLRRYSMAIPGVSLGNLVEVADSPMPSRMSPIQSRSATEKAKNFALVFLIGAVLCSVSWWLLHNGYTFYGISAGLVGLFALIAAFGGSQEKATCPFCGATLDILDRKEGRKVRCEKCSEYSIVNAGLVRPLDPVVTS